MSLNCRLLALSALLFSSRVLAQAGGSVTGSISGVVLDGTTQAPLADAVVTARGPALTGEQGVVTDQKGAFEITMLPAGSYSLTIQHDRFLPFSPDGVGVHARRTVKVRLALARLQDTAAPPSGAPAQGGSTPPATSSAMAAAAVSRAVEFNEATMTAPVIISGPPPEYTQKAIEREVEGLMVVRCVVTAEGFVFGCKVIKNVQFMDRAVIDSLLRRRYKPATLQGKPLDVFYTFNVRLKLPQ